MMSYIVNWEKIVEEKKVPIYECGSINLCNFLLMHECIYIDHYKSTKSGKTIWAFVKTKRVEGLLTEWTANNPNKIKKKEEILHDNGENKQ